MYLCSLCVTFEIQESIGVCWLPIQGSEIRPPDPAIGGDSSRIHRRRHKYHTIKCIRSNSLAMEFYPFRMSLAAVNNTDIFAQK